MTLATIHYDSPAVLGNHAIDLRNSNRYYDRTDCQIGWHDGTVRLADDNGAIDFAFLAEGTIQRTSYGSPGTLAQDVDRELHHYVTAHNQDLFRAMRQR